MTTLDRSVHSMLDLSTAHIPQSRYFGGLRFSQTEYGYVVFVDPYQANVPKWLRPIHDYAVDRDCILINFDANSHVIDDFEAFDGEES